MSMPAVQSDVCVSEDSITRLLVEGVDDEHLDRHLSVCAACRRLFAQASELFGSDAVARAESLMPTFSVAPPADGPSGAEVTDAHLFRIVDDDEYLVGRELARGGMGRILEAVDRHGRRVAMKVLLRDDDAFRRRFAREVRITARLQHPATTTVLDTGQWRSGELFFSMKLVEGRSLLDYLAETADLKERLALLPRLLAISEALAYVHTRAIVHRDLKPANVILGSFGETVVIDWGLAKVVGTRKEGEPDVPAVGNSDAELTQDGTRLGTPAYMSPEQARGEAVDPRTDVYSLGALLYHVLARTPPYHAPTVRELLDRVLAGPPEPLEQRAPGLPPDLVAIVRKSMDREADRRYPSAREMATDLQRCTTGRLVSAHTYSPRALMRRWVRRHRAPVAVAAVLCRCCR